jgi:predicted phage-related endonuclease
VQGSDDWIAFRFEHDGASEAAAALGLSKKVPRNELLNIKHTGLPKEFSAWVQEKILDHGHAVEALARPIVEEIIGEDLYPVTCSDGRLSASCDGLTLDDCIAFEHKQWAAELAASVERKELPKEHAPQCQQVLMVTGAEKLIFVVSDGTRDNLVYMWVYPDPAWFERIRAGWAQFNQDLADYVLVETIAPIVASPTLNLPAVSVQVQGSIALISNLDVFGAALKGFIAKIPEKPSTDQEFADCKSAIGKLQAAQDALDAAEANALGQIATFDEMRHTKALYFDLARITRLALEKLVTQREAAIKVEITQKSKAIYDAHVESLKAETGGPWIVLPGPDFAGAIKNKRTVASLQNAVDTALANGKIAADASAKNIRTNLACIRDYGIGYEFLFSDKLALISKPIDDLMLLVRSRIADHKAAEAKRIADETARIREEERVKAEAKAKADADAKAKADAEAAVKVQADQDAARKAAAPDPGKEMFEAMGIKVIDATPQSSGAPRAGMEPGRAPEAYSFPSRAAPASTPSAPTLTLGKIGTRLGFSLTADFLRGLGFEPVRERSAVLFHESDWQAICTALLNHIDHARSHLQQAA